MKKILKTLSAYVILSLSYLPTLTASKLFSEFSKIDLLITNGQVLDGLGNKAVLSDVVIVGDEIVFVGQTNFSTEELRLSVKKSINAKQRILAPGFIDLHSHGDPLAKIVGKNDRLIMSHMRNEDSDQLSASIAELVRQGQFAKVHISHIKSVYGAGDSEAEDIIKIFRYAKKSGIQLSADIYPYNASYAGISLLFPVWAKTTEQFVVALKERREELEQFLRDKIIKRNGPEAAKIFGITDRGIIRAGMKADIIIFDPSQIKANASYSKPHLLAQGFDTVIINGNIARQSEKMNTALFGKVLKP
jgi:cytosine/adenosine deaminase-related metal-dependent hydrolase